MKIINLSLNPLQRMPGEKSMLYSVTFSSINAQFCNIAFSQMVYCTQIAAALITFHSASHFYAQVFIFSKRK